ncbi:hypothetical protein KKI93_25155, partial [Xenorhabdus bovienii]|uniref:hypothetical protein n=1 Tax=Xenorhabdus bovienii TaxID=40576 RepID=UPI0023B2D4EB
IDNFRMLLIPMSYTNDFSELTLKILNILLFVGRNVNSIFASVNICPYENNSYNQEQINVVRRYSRKSALNLFNEIAVQ